MVRYLGPYQTVCDDWNYWWTYLAEHLSAPDQVRLRPARADQPRGPVRRQRRPAGRDHAGQRHLGQRQPAADRVRRQAVPPRPVLRRGDRQPGQRRLRDRPARIAEEAQRVRSRRAATSPSTPTRRATRARPSTAVPDVPAGETFSRNPQTGPQLPTTANAMTRRRRRRGHEHLQGRGDRDRRDRRCSRTSRSRSSPTRSPARSPSTRSSPAPAGCAPRRSCGSPASTSARSQSISPRARLQATSQRRPIAVLGRATSR